MPAPPGPPVGPGVVVLAVSPPGHVTWPCLPCTSVSEPAQPRAVADRASTCCCRCQRLSRCCVWAPMAVSRSAVAGSASRPSWATRCRKAWALSCLQLQPASPAGVRADQQPSWAQACAGAGPVLHLDRSGGRERSLSAPWAPCTERPFGKQAMPSRLGPSPEALKESSGGQSQSAGCRTAMAGTAAARIGGPCPALS